MRATLLWMAAALAVLVTCSGAARADRSSPVASSCPEVLEARYFPVGTLRGQGDDSFVRRWYSSYLAVVEEPSLSCGRPEDTEAYRFLWLRSFHDAVAVRFFRRGDVYGLEAVIVDDRFHESHLRYLLDGTGDYKPGNVARRVTKALSPDQWRTMIARLEEIQFWQMPTHANKIRGTDGAQWVVDARRDGRYHVVDRWIGTDGLKSVGMLFLDLAGLNDVGPVY